MSHYPTGAVTFLFTDIEGSTPLWDRLPDAMRRALARHNALLRQAVEAHSGVVFKTIGDACQAAFALPDDAVAAAVVAQQALQSQPDEAWGETGPLRVRMGLHVGRGEWEGTDYAADHSLNRVARVMAAGHGGQVLVTEAVAELVRGRLVAGVELRDLGKHRLKGLSAPEHLYQVVTPGLRADFPPLNTLSNRPLHLPTPLTAFIGREGEVASVKALLQKADVRLVTLTGVGGVGKTRLAIEIAAQLHDDFTHGVYFVNLAPLSDPSLVVSTMAQVLEVAEKGGRSVLDLLKEHLREKRLLLVLDNFEQVVEAAAQVGELLQAAPGVKALVTSRVVLHVRGEREVAVQPLSRPDIKHLPPLAHLSQYEAIRLFVERALDVRPDFALTQDNAPAVAEICHRLDGVPLAIELAAARIKLFSPQTLLQQMEKRLKTLTEGPRDRPKRHQTLHDTIAWSYDLLAPAEQALFRRLAVFVGGWRLEAAEAVCGESTENDGRRTEDESLGAGHQNLPPSSVFRLPWVYEGVASLVDKSLVQPRHEGDGEPRFIMLETIREYALERLEEAGEADALRRQHAHYFVGLTEEAETKFATEERVWMDRLEVEYDNLRSVLAFSKEWNEAEILVRLATVLYLFWLRRSYYTEGQQWLADMLALAQSGRVAPSLQAKALFVAGKIAHRNNDFEMADRVLSQGLAVYCQIGDRRGEANCLRYLGHVALELSDPRLARSRLEASLAIYQTLEDKRHIAYTLVALAYLMHSQRDAAGARVFAHQALSLFEALDNKWEVADALSLLGYVETGEGRLASAHACFARMLEIFRQLGDKRGICWGLKNLGSLAFLQGDYRAARLLFEEDLSLCQERGDRIDVAMSLLNMGWLNWGEGDHATARQQLMDSLATLQEQGKKALMVDCLVALAGVAAAQRQFRSAVLLMGAVTAFNARHPSPFDPFFEADYERVLTRLQGQVDASDFMSQWGAGRSMALEQAVAFALQGVA